MAIKVIFRPFIILFEQLNLKKSVDRTLLLLICCSLEKKCSIGILTHWDESRYREKYTLHPVQLSFLG
jgi:hypothetical protein